MDRRAWRCRCQDTIEWVERRRGYNGRRGTCGISETSRQLVQLNGLPCLFIGKSFHRKHSSPQSCPSPDPGCMTPCRATARSVYIGAGGILDRARLPSSRPTDTVDGEPCCTSGSADVGAVDGPGVAEERDDAEGDSLRFFAILSSYTPTFAYYADAGCSNNIVISTRTDRR